MAGPLDGVKILDLTSLISGPGMTMLLGDQGADVIKVENPNGGDQTRRAGGKRDGLASSFLNNNRNKRSVVIDLKHPDGVALFKELTRSADVVAQNFRPGVVQRIGVGYEHIKAINADIIYLSIAGFGHEGPYAKKPVYDPIIQALSGLTSVQGGSDEARPRLVRTILPDKLTSMVAAQSVTAALLAKEKGRGGQHIRLAMLDVLIGFLWGSDMGGHTFVGEEVERETPQSDIDLIFETATDYITIAVQTDKQWHGLCAALDQPGLLEDERFKTLALRSKNINIRLQLVQDVLLRESAEHWLKVLEENDVPSAPVLTRRAMINHPQTEANDILKFYDHPDAGRLRQPRPVAQFSGTIPEMRYPAPRLGQHTVEVLQEAGFTQERIKALFADNIVKGEMSPG